MGIFARNKEKSVTKYEASLVAQHKRGPRFFLHTSWKPNMNEGGATCHLLSSKTLTRSISSMKMSVKQRVTDENLTRLTNPTLLTSSKTCQVPWSAASKNLTSGVINQSFESEYELGELKARSQVSCPLGIKGVKAQTFHDQPQGCFDTVIL